jgi:antitoxin (DNA-binding transcriptional repressor) of toxin-antitoxin stability system
MSASDARAHLPELLDRVERGEEVTITRHDRAVAVVVRPDTLRARRADTAMTGAEALRGLLNDMRARPLEAATDLCEDRAEELIAAVRAGRDAR